MTAELWIPEPFDDFPYLNEPLDTADLKTPLDGMGSAVSSAPVSPAASAGGPTPGALPLSEPEFDGPRPNGNRDVVEAGVSKLTVSSGSLTFSCAACLLEWPEPFCDVCGARLHKGVV